MVTRVKNLSGRRAYIALGVLLASVASVALAATFNLFQPAAGILKGNPSTYVTTAAASSDVIALWTGTCNSSSALKGDGSCGTLAAGTVSSVGLTMPTGFSVSGSPVTTTGTLGVTTTLNGPVRGNGSGLITGNTALATEVSGLLPVANGGIGVGTLTGIAKGNGTAAFTSAVASDVYGLWAGGCSSSNFLRGDGTCASPGGGGTVTSLTSGTGIALSPSTITATGSVNIDTAVVPRLGVANAFTAAGNSFSSSGLTLSVVGTSAAEIFRLNGPTTTGYFRIQENSTDRAYIGYGSAVISGAANTDLGITPASGGQIRFGTAGGAATAMSISGAGVVNVNNASSLTVAGTQVCLSTGTNCPSPGVAASNFASAAVTAASGCGPSPFGISACTHNSTGNYSITLTPGISNARCTVSQDLDSFPAAALVAMVHTTSFNNVNVRWMNTSAAAVDAAFIITCQF